MPESPANVNVPLLSAPPPVPLRLGKRAFDFVVSAAAILVLAPVFIGGVLVLWLDFLLHPANRGPLLYRETRVSRGRAFTIYKFRIIKQSCIDAARATPEGLITIKRLERDPATLTASGYWFKRFYIDELPQLFNILFGDMTLVGPRPWPPREYNDNIESVGPTKGRVPCGLAGPVQGMKGRQIDYHQLERDYVAAYETLGPFALIRHDLGHIWGAIKIMREGKGI